MGSALRVAATACALLTLLMAFQSLQAQASPPNTGANEWNHASSYTGGVASASGYSGSNAPAKANDQDPSTSWQSSTTTGWLAIKFAGKGTIDEVHAHFTTTTYPKLSLKAAIAIGVSLAITASIAAMLYLVLPSADPFWREGLGLSFISVALAVEKSPQIIKGFRADPTGV